MGRWIDRLNSFTEKRFGLILLGILVAVLLFFLIVILSCGEALAGTIIVEVRDDETGLPINGAYASVRIFDEEKAEWPVVLADSTNANGLLVFRDLDKGNRCFILVTADKYFDWIYKNKFNLEIPDILVIEDDYEIVKLKILLSPLQPNRGNHNLSVQQKSVPVHTRTPK